jgi:hypothetical protein
MKSRQKNKAIVAMFLVVIVECGLLMLWTGSGDRTSESRRLSSSGDDGMLGGCEGSKGLLAAIYVVRENY